MANSSLDNVNELLRLIHGDKGRLEDIKRRLENGQALYISDNNYLQQLVNQYRGEIQKIIEFKTPEPTPEPEPEPTRIPEPTPEPKIQFESKSSKTHNTKIMNKKSNKKKKIGIVVGVLLIVFVTITLVDYQLAVNAQNDVRYWELKNSDCNSFNCTMEAVGLANQICLNHSYYLKSSDFCALVDGMMDNNTYKNWKQQSDNLNNQLNKEFDFQQLDDAR